MTSRSGLLSTLPADPPDLLACVMRTTAQGLQSGALQPIETLQTTLIDGGIPFTVRWMSSLAQKDKERLKKVIRPNPVFNPFLPPEPDLTVATIGNQHLAVLNKYPVMTAHVLIVTREFEPQSAALTPADLTALGKVITRHGGLGFFNGGRAAGASQPHRHLQWIPDSGRMETFTGPLPAIESGSLTRHPGLPWQHGFLRLPHTIWTETEGQGIHTAYTRAMEAVGLPLTSDTMPPYNLLLTREWLLVVPRSQEHWEGISINALGYSGSLFITRPEQLEHIQRTGPLSILTATGHVNNQATAKT